VKFLADSLHSIAVTLWVGGLWVVGLMVAPLLFHALADRSVAGQLAGQFFSGMAWVGLGCAAYLVLFRLARFGPQALRQLFFWCVLVMAALTAASHFGIQPIMAGLREQALPSEVMQSLLRDRFAAWHGVSSALYLVQCGLGIVLVVLAGRSS
jgi:hypothetical protein